MKTSKAGSKYLVITIVTETGRISGKIWSTPEELFDAAKDIKPGRAVYLRGCVQAGFKDGPEEVQISVIEPLSDRHPVQDLLNAKCPAPLPSLMARLDALKAQIQRPAMKELLDLVLNAANFKRFVAAPAAVLNHHNYIHGLLEHSVEVAELAHFAATRPGVAASVDLDMIVVAAILHDLGKVQEYCWAGEPIGVSCRGRLLPHVVLGPLMLWQAVSPHWEDLEKNGLTGGEVQHLTHIMASHHGRLDWGSPIEPRSIEATIIHHADNMSAQTRSMCDAVAAGTQIGSGWVKPEWPYKHPLYVGKQ